MNALIDATLDKLVADIMGGKLDWKKTWVGGGGMPRNYTTKARYNGINVILLWLARQDGNYPTAKWATYKQWQAAGFQVAKGEKSTTILIAKDAVKKGKDGADDEHYKMFKCAFVFNAAQLVEPPVEAAAVPRTENQRRDDCDATVKATGAGIVTSDSPHYVPTLDVIGMPGIERFTSADAYYATLFHELVHWTGHKSRMDRELKQTDKEYAFEELIAEIGAAFLCAEHDVDELPGHNNHAAYLQTWLKKFPDDMAGAIMKAASAASKAVAFIEQAGAKQMEQAA